MSVPVSAISFKLARKLDPQRRIWESSNSNFNKIAILLRFSSPWRGGDNKSKGKRSGAFRDPGTRVWELNARGWTPGVEPCAETKSSRHCHLGRDSRFLHPLASLLFVPPFLPPSLSSPNGRLYPEESSQFSYQFAVPFHLPFHNFRNVRRGHSLSLFLYLSLSISLSSLFLSPVTQILDIAFIRRTFLGYDERKHAKEERKQRQKRESVKQSNEI